MEIGEVACLEEVANVGASVFDTDDEGCQVREGAMESGKNGRVDHDTRKKARGQEYREATIRWKDFLEKDTDKLIFACGNAGHLHLCSK